jgi:flagellar biosynthesis protein FlhF
MIIKSYAATTVAEALKMIREELGGEAVILKTRVSPENDGKGRPQFEVTACIDEKLARRPRIKQAKTEKTSDKITSTPETDKKAASILEKQNNLNPETIEKSLNNILNIHRYDESASGLPESVMSIFYNLLDSDLAIEIARRIAKETAAGIKEHDDPEYAAFNILKDELGMLTSTSIRIEAGTKVAFIGPSGGGKTSVMAKTAAELCAKFKQKIKLVTLDQVKLSAVPEIDAYGHWLDLPAEMINEMNREDYDDAVLLIDTPALSRTSSRQDKLLSKLESIKPEIVFLVFSAACRTPDLIDIAVKCERFAPHFLIASHLDETDRWGGIMTMAEYLNVPVAFVTDSPGGEGGLKMPDSAILAKRMLKMEAWSHEQ